MLNMICSSRTGIFLSTWVIYQCLRFSNDLLNNNNSNKKRIRQILLQLFFFFYLKAVNFLCFVCVLRFHPAEFSLAASRKRKAPGCSSLAYASKEAAIFSLVWRRRTSKNGWLVATDIHLEKDNIAYLYNNYLLIDVDFFFSKKSRIKVTFFLLSLVI